mgnify:CR=1 FL=1
MSNTTDSTIGLHVGSPLPQEEIDSIHKKYIKQVEKYYELVYSNLTNPYKLNKYEFEYHKSLDHLYRFRKLYGNFL